MQAVTSKLWFSNRDLIASFTRREIFGRYKGSYLGVFWSLLTPLIMLSVYLFVFGFVFKSRFGYSANESAIDFGLGLFCSLNLFNMFAEVITRASGLIASQPNYVKKVVFPLEIIPVSLTGGALFHCLIAFVPLVALLFAFHQAFSVSVLYIPLYLAPFAVFCLGVAWAVSAIGVFIKDLQILLSSLVTVLMFLSAVFYPVSAVPAQLRGLVLCNPLAGYLDTARKSIVWGLSPDWFSYLEFLGVSLITYWLGKFIFERSKTAFADVL